MKILAVDDQPDNLELLIQILEEHEVITANSGAECLKLAKEQKPDMIILDVMMPEINGYETMEKLQEDSSLKNIPVLFLSARYRDTDRVIKGLKLGAFDYLTKPLDDEILLAKVHAVSRMLSAEKELREHKEILEAMVHQRTSELSKAKKSRESFRNLAKHIENIRELERKGFAREIHDEIGQILFALKMDLHWINKQLTETVSTVIKDKIQSMLSLVDTSVDAVRQISSQLRPIILDELGLESTIQWYITEFQEHTPITCNINTKMGNLIIDENQSIAVYRIFQETMANAGRHSGANKIDIELDNQDGCLHLMIKDNGCGINKSKIKNPKSFGLQGMKERAEAIGGNLLIEAIQGEGTSVRLSLPINTN